MDGLAIRRYSWIWVSPMSSQGFLHVKAGANGSEMGKMRCCVSYMQAPSEGWKRRKKKMLPERFHKQLGAADASGATK